MTDFFKAIAALAGAIVAIAAMFTAFGLLPQATPSPAPLAAPSVVSGASPPPDISGSYRLGPGSPRIIAITLTGQDEYAIEEASGPYSFHGTVSWTGGQHFQGTAKFDDSRATMRVVLDRQADATLDTRFEFLTDGDGWATTRVDPHVLVPVE